MFLVLTVGINVLIIIVQAAAQIYRAKKSLLGELTDDALVWTQYAMPFGAYVENKVVNFGFEIYTVQSTKE